MSVPARDSRGSRAVPAPAPHLAEVPPVQEAGDPPGRYLLGMRVDATSYADATDRILSWAAAHESRYVTVATVNNVMESYEDASFRRIMDASDLVTPDGVPLVWGLRALGVRRATRVYGPDLTPHVLRAAAQQGVPVGFYGGSQDVLDVLLQRVRVAFPDLRIVFGVAPPFRTLTAEEDEQINRDIEASGARIVFVGLGCPKQERWMSEHRPSLRAVMVGVGAAFDFLAGSKRQAPAVLQRMGLEWLFRLATEPRRLWRRYLRHNPRFVVLFGRQVLRTKLRRALGSADDEEGNDRI
jgi:N-acetylglucosaminyldiphosphoundecaprenol N-acetyl-beta-D-mannosaminyltransferase